TALGLSLIATTLLLAATSLSELGNWIVVILEVAFALGIVIFVHELGHFAVAKWCGVKCEKFYLGFDIYGLKLAKFRWGETEYGIGILPLGGYVKMLGQDDNPSRAAEERRRSQIPIGTDVAGSEMAPDPNAGYTLDPRSYMAQSVPKRMAIISAGVIMNVIFALVAAAVAYGLGVKEVPCIVRGVVPGGAAWQENLEPGDVIKRIGKIQNPRFRDLISGVTLGDIENGIEFQIERPSTGKTFDNTLHPDTSLGIPMIGIVGPWGTTLIDDPDMKPTLKNSS